MKLGSLCSGAGGLDMAVEAVFNAETVWHCELDAAASKVLAHRWPGVPNYRDLTAMGWTGVEPIDILCAGWPCQPFSLAGKQKGADDERAIWPEIARAVRVLRPRIVVLENVSAVLRVEFGRVADTLAALGYDLRWTCLRASDVGAPHRRERLFVVAYAHGWGLEVSAQRDGQSQRSELTSPLGRDTRRRGDDAADTTGDGRHEGWPEPARLLGRPDVAERGDGVVELLPTPRSLDATGVRGRTENRSDAANYRAGRTLTDVTEHELLPTPAAARSGRNQSPSPGAAVRPSLDMIDALLPTPRTSDTNGAGLHGNGGPDLRTTVAMLCTPSASDGEGGKTSRSGDRIDEPLLGGQAREMAQSWGKYAPAIARWETVTRPAPSPTEPNKNGNPRLSAAFSEWLMGWPAGWVTDVPGISRNDQLRIVGNGVVPQCAAAALEYLLSLEVAA